jgi:iron complex transport system substrate-binding protein
MRICSLLPGATEIAFALGLGNEIVGVTHECDFPLEARRKPIVVRSRIASGSLSSCEIDQRVGELLRAGESLYAIDEEAFRAAAPDVILTQALCEVCAIDYDEVKAAAKGLSTEPIILALSPHCLSDVLRDIERVGEISRRGAEAESLVCQIRERIERVQHQAEASRSRPRVACLEWFDPVYAAGHWVPEMVELAGGVDVLSRKGEPSAPVEWSSVLRSAPEIIVLMPCGFDLPRAKQESIRLQCLEGWHRLPAVEDGRVYAVNATAFFSRPGPRLADGLEILARIIHPESFSDEHLNDRVQRLIGNFRNERPG